MMDDMILIAAGASAACGCAALRYAWSLPQRSPVWNAAGWGLLALGVVLGWSAAGAWGSAVASLVGMAAAMVFLAYSAWTAPIRVAGKASNRRVGALPEAGEARHIRRRVMTFLIVVVGAWIVSTGIAVAARSLMAWAGAGEANANVTAFFVIPLAWTALAFALLMEERRSRQWRMLAICAVPGIVATAIGLSA